MQYTQTVSEFTQGAFLILRALAYFAIAQQIARFVARLANDPVRDFIFLPVLIGTIVGLAKLDERWFRRPRTTDIVADEF